MRKPFLQDVRISYPACFRSRFRYLRVGRLNEAARAAGATREADGAVGCLLR